MLLGKQVRLNRIFSNSSGKYVSVAIDHGISYNNYELPKGIDQISETIAQIVAGKPDSITLQKGIASICFPPFAGQVPLIIESTAFVPNIPWKDYQIAFVEECIALGADAIAMAIGVLGESQGEEIAMLARLVRDAQPFGMPVIAHVYPKGSAAKQEDFYSLKYVKYAAHVAAEVGVDAVKVPYTGSAESFAEVVRSCPIRVVAAGGPKTNTHRELFEMAHGVISAGAAGITFGRNIWQDDHIVALITALKELVHCDRSVSEALEIYKTLAEKGRDPKHG